MSDQDNRVLYYIERTGTPILEGGRERPPD